MNKVWIAATCVVGSMYAWNSGVASARQPQSVPRLDSDYAGKTIVITGASSGFGRGIALALAQKGANVVLAARRKEVLDALATECGAKALVVPTDVSSATEVEHLCQQAVNKFGRIDVWINDAGVGALGRFTEIPLADQKRVVETNLVGTMNGSYYAMREFRKQNGGTLINIASMVGKLPTAYYPSYSASKAGVIALDATISAELAADKVKGIHICSVCPMAAETPFWAHASNYTGHVMNPKPVYKPDKVVNAVVKLVANPHKTVIVGNRAKLAVAFHKVMPGTTEKMYAKFTHRYQFEKAAPIAATSGSIYEPTPVGQTVEMKPDGSVSQPM